MKNIETDLKTITDCLSPTSEDCRLASKLDEGLVHRYCIENLVLRLADPRELTHFLCHVMIDSYRLGFQAKCKELEVAECEKIAKCS